MSSEPSSLADLRYTCRVCFESLLPPVFQCRNGHLMCDECSSRLKKCGVCRVTLPRVHRVRSLEVEKIIRVIRHPCPSEIEGCQAKLKLKQMEAHRFECSYTKFPICELLFGFRHCEEVGICDYEEHYVKKHGWKPVNDTATLPVGLEVKLSREDFDDPGCFTNSKFEFGKQTILFIVDLVVDAAHNSLQCRPWVLAGKAVANQLNCKISFSSGKDFNVTMDAPIFNLETKKEELLAGAGIPWKYYQTYLSSPPVKETGKAHFLIKLSKKPGTFL